MKIAFAVLLLVHGAIHLIGVSRAFALASGTPPVSPIIGAMWLAAAIGFAGTAVLLFIAPGRWWMLALPAVVVSQVAIVSAWHEARFGTIANVAILVPLVISMLDMRASSLHSRYVRDVEEGLARVGHAAPATPITETELAPLPPLVQAYLRRAGVVGKPHVRSLHAVFRGQMRQGPDGAWMDMTADQYSFFDQPTRLFFMHATRSGVPIDAFHRYRGAHATFEVRIAGLYPIVDVAGPEMDQSETVTMFNDMCLLAPGALVDAPVAWQPVDATTVRGTYTNAGHTIHAELEFSPEGDLVGFVSRDRYQLDGETVRLVPWSTPVSSYGEFPRVGEFRRKVPRIGEDADTRAPGSAEFAGYHLWKRAEARWIDPAGEWAYARFELVELDYGVNARGATGLASDPP